MNSGGGGIALDQRGEGKAGCLLSIAILIVAAYIGIQYVGSEIDYRSLSGEVQRQASLAADHTDEVIRQALMARATELELPPSAHNVQIVRRSNEIEIAIRYADTLTLFGRYDWALARRIRHQRPF